MSEESVVNNYHPFDNAPLTYKEVKEVLKIAWKHLNRYYGVCKGCEFDKEYCSDYNCHSYNIFEVCFEDYLMKRCDKNG